MSELKAGEAIATAVIQVKRKETGKVEEYTLTFTPEKQETEQKEASNGGDSRNGD